MPSKLFKIFGAILLMILMSAVLPWNFESLKYSCQWTTRFSTLQLRSSGYELMKYVTALEGEATEVDNSTDHIELINPELVVYYQDRSISNQVTKTNIDVYVNLNNLREQIRKNSKNCRTVRNPMRLWKAEPSGMNKFTANMDFKRIGRASLCGGFLYPEFLKMPPRETLYPFEAAYLSEPPVWNIRTVSSHQFSTIELASSKNFTVGDTVSFIIHIADGMGRPKLVGGDRIKVWLKDERFDHSIAARIVDFDNGTYLATTVLAWAGTVRVMAILRQPREYIRALIYTLITLKTTLTFTGAYTNSKASEAVLCSPHPIIPSFNETELCNLTLLNGSPWFCASPSKPELNCSDFNLVRYYKKSLDFPVTAAENNILNQKLTTKSGYRRLEDPNVTCSNVPYKSTWHQATPIGYFFNNQWKSFLCFIPNKIEPSCFKNVHMIFYGDSNSRESFDMVVELTKCFEPPDQKKGHWHNVQMCENLNDNFTTKFIGHSNPFHSGTTNFTNYRWFYPPAKLFNTIPSTGRYIISFNHFIHYTSHHISVYENTLVSLRDALTSLLNRNPEVLAVLRAPHVAELPPITPTRGDSLAEYFILMQKEVFKSLHGRIVYLPTWDITIASEDTDPHPQCNPHIAHVMLQFLCGRESNR